MLRQRVFQIIRSIAKAAKHRLLAQLRFLFIAIVVCSLQIQTSHAQGSDAQRRAAISQAMNQAGGFGKVISVKPQKTQDGAPGFRVRILTDGRVRTFDVPAAG